MRTVLWIAGLALAVSTIQPADAYSCKDGQMPAPPELAAQMALPLCGFAATKRWGANGCQLCDARNMYPNPFDEGVPPDRSARHAHRYRGYQ
jgi:hypothetical protein